MVLISFPLLLPLWSNQGGEKGRGGTVRLGLGAPRPPISGEPHPSSRSAWLPGLWGFWLQGGFVPFMGASAWLCSPGWLHTPQDPPASAPEC